MRLFVVVQGDEIVVTSETDFRAAYCNRPNFPQLKVRRRTGRRGFLAAELLGALAAAYLFRWLFEAIVMPAGPKIVDYGGRRECPLWVIRWGNRPACLWIAEDLGCCASD